MSATARADVMELSRQIHNLSRRCKRAQASRAAAEELLGPDGRARRCASDSLMCMLVYIFSGHCSQTAADFVRGRGWRPGLSDLAEQEEIVADVEWAYIGMPTVTLVDLELAPLTLVSKKDVLCAAQYVLERRLAAYVEVQNIQHGVAPSREQLVECATSSIPSAAPADVQHRLLSLVQGNPRKERKYLAKFRLRWNAKYACLRVQDNVDIAERREKAGFLFYQQDVGQGWLASNGFY